MYMNMILSYIRVSNLQNTMSFLTQTSNLSKVETVGNDIGECILYFRQNKTFKLSIRENLGKFAIDQEQKDYLFALDTKCYFRRREKAVYGVDALVLQLRDWRNIPLRRVIHLSNFRR